VLKTSPLKFTPFERLAEVILLDTAVASSRLADDNITDSNVAGLCLYASANSNTEENFNRGKGLCKIAGDSSCGNEACKASWEASDDYIMAANLAQTIGIYIVGISLLWIVILEIQDFLSSGTFDREWTNNANLEGIKRWNSHVIE
jgi:hypothetical protein